MKGVLDKEEVLRAKHNGHLFATHVVVGTPECLAELSVQPSAFPLSSCLRAVAVDEIDGYSQVTMDQQPSLKHTPDSEAAGGPGSLSVVGVCLMRVLAAGKCKLLQISALSAEEEHVSNRSRASL